MAEPITPPPMIATSTRPVTATAPVGMPPEPGISGDVGQPAEASIEA
jgi:hypothetical protein